MNITYLIGNGFDLGLGLKTKYEDFYPFFLEKADATSRLRKEIEISENSRYEKWSDLEMALGKYTEKIEATEEDINRFVDEKVELDQCLRDYLSREQEKFIIQNKSSIDSLISALTHFKNGTNENEKALIKKSLESYMSAPFVYQCITFNYTKCVDQIWKALSNEEIGKHTYGSKTYRDLIGDVLHIHGSLDDNEMILGVNDETQILNTALAGNSYVKWALIKPHLNQELGQNKIQKARKMIDSSVIICAYGMSMGQTDNMWWEYIGKWLKRRDTNIFVIYNYELNYQETHPVKRLMHIENVRRFFLEKTKLTPSEQEAVSSKIVVFDNETVFAL